VLFKIQCFKCFNIFKIALSHSLNSPGDDLVVSIRSPGLFLQGLSVHGLGGVLLSDAQLPASAVEQAFKYVQSDRKIL
jgi:hypothetical protein